MRFGAEFFPKKNAMTQGHPVLRTQDPGTDFFLNKKCQRSTSFGWPLAFLANFKRRQHRIREDYTEKNLN